MEEISDENVNLIDLTDLEAYGRDVSDEIEELELHPFTIQVIVRSILLFIGLILNFIVIIIFIRHRSMRRLLNIYIASLSLTDITLILIMIPESIAFMTHNWYLGEFMCKFMTSSHVTLEAVSSLTFIPISIEIFRNVKSNRRLIPMIVINIIWLIASVFSIPSFNHSYLHVSNITLRALTHQVSYCILYDDSKNILLIATEIMVDYVLPVLFMILLFTLLQCHCCIFTPEQKKKESSCLLLVLILFFTLCKLPNLIFTTTFRFYPNYWDNRWVQILHGDVSEFGLRTIYLCLKPIIYWLFSNSYKIHMSRYLLCCCVSPGRGYQRENSASSDEAIELSMNHIS